MPSLLEQVLENKSHPTADSLLSPKDDQAHKLADGSVVYDSTIAAINRILELNPHLHKRATGIPAHPYALYNGNQPVDLSDKRTFLSLIKADFVPKTEYQLVLLELQVLELAPIYSRDCFIIAQGLIWDVAEARLKSFGSTDDIKTVS